MLSKCANPEVPRCYGISTREKSSIWPLPPTYKSSWENSIRRCMSGADCVPDARKK